MGSVVICGWVVSVGEMSRVFASRVSIGMMLSMSSVISSGGMSVGY